MGVSGAWRAKTEVPYVGALAEGTGWNAIHATRGGDVGRGTATHGTIGAMPREETAEFQPEMWGYMDEDVPNVLYGFGSQTGTADRDSWGMAGSDTRASSNHRGGMQNDYPGYGSGTAARNGGPPAGTFIRSVNRGADIINNTKTQQPEGLLHEGYKLTSYVEDAVDSDPAQLMMQTSEVQRDKTRYGSQSASRGTDDPRSPIGSRIPGMRLPEYSGGYRHAEMEPKEQAMIIRPFYVRTAATGNPDWLDTNEMYVSQPRLREPVSEPGTGEPVSVVMAPEIAPNPYNYTAEDLYYVY